MKSREQPPPPEGRHPLPAPSPGGDGAGGDTASPWTRRYNFVRLYGQLGKTLDARYGTEALGRALADARAERARNPGADDFGMDGALHRWLRRLGALPSTGGTREASAAVTGEFVRAAAATVNRTPFEVAAMLRLFTRGLPDDDGEPVCGATPRCGECGATRDCDYFNTPVRPMNDPIPPLARLAVEGAHALTDEELVALVVGGARGTRKDVDMAREVLGRYGTLRGLFSASYTELAGLRALSPASAARLAAAAELHVRVENERRYYGPTIRMGADFFELFHARMRDLKKEVFYVVLLDSRSRVIKDVRLSEGTLTYTVVHPREVFGPAVRESAAMLGLVHNHPSGDSAPSAEDIALTRELHQMAAWMKMPLLDHVVIGEGGYTSMVDMDVIQPPQFYKKYHGHIVQ